MIIEKKQKNQFFIYNNEIVTDSYENIFNINLWEENVVGSAKGRGTTWFIQWKNLQIALKHYFRGGLWGKVVKDKYLYLGLNRTRSWKEFYLLEQLRMEGLPVPQAIAAKVKKKFLLYQTDIITERIENAESIISFLTKNNLKVEQFIEIGKIVKKMHRLNVCHTDLNANNILIDSSNKIWLIDFDKCSKREGDYWKKNNLNRLKRSFEKESHKFTLNLTSDYWDYILQGYSL